MEHPVEGIAKIQPEESGSPPVASAPASPSRPANAPAPEAPRDTVDISAAAQVAAEASAQALKAQQAPKKGPEPAPQPEASASKGLAPNISFNYNKEVGILQAAVVDPVTHKVIRQIPPDEVLKMGLRFRNFVRERFEAAEKVSDAPTVGFESGQEGDEGDEQAA